MQFHDYDIDITEQVINIDGKFSWTRASANAQSDVAWNNAHQNITGENANKITLYVSDVEKNSQFQCSVDFDETKIQTTT